MAKEQNGFWVNGCNSLDDPVAISKTSYVFGYNILNRGGIIRTRPGFGELCASPVGLTVQRENTPQGATIFSPLGSVPHLVIAHGGVIYVSPYPWTTFRALPGLTFRPHRQIIFETTLKTAQTNNDGSLTFLPRPYPVLIIQDGVTRAGFWDGSISRHCDQTPIPSAHETPIAAAMKWIGDRLWTANGRTVRASNIGDPLKNTDEALVAEGGFFTVPGDVTAMGVTPDLQALLVCTDENTTTFQAGILDRTAWRTTPNFQKVLFPTIGCVGPKAIANQFGLTWIYSHDGLIGLDSALATYRSSRIRYRDRVMARSKANLSSDLSGVCLGVHENFLLVSVPSGDRHNAHTWVLDETVTQGYDEPTAFQGTELSAFAGVWTGIRPVEWVSAVVRKRKRLFALSRDYAPAGQRRSRYVVGIWEALMSQRADSLIDGTAKRIRCGFESRTMLVDDTLKKLAAIEAGLSELRGKINIKIFWAGVRTDYRLADEKQIIASAGAWGSPAKPLITPDTKHSSFRRQQRLIRCEEIVQSRNESVQSEYNSDIDQGFSTYLEWYGDMALRFVRMLCEEKADIHTVASDTEIESTQRYVDDDGSEKVLEEAEPEPVALKTDSRFADTLSIRYPEPLYSSR